MCLAYFVNYICVRAMMLCNIASHILLCCCWRDAFWIVGFIIFGGQSARQKLSRSFCSGTGCPRWSQKKGRKMVVVVWFLSEIRLASLLTCGFFPFIPRMNLWV